MCGFSSFSGGLEIGQGSVPSSFRVTWLPHLVAILMDLTVNREHVIAKEKRHPSELVVQTPPLSTAQRKLWQGYF